MRTVSGDAIPARGAVIIPAILSDPGSVDQLLSVVAELPADADRVIVVAQAAGSATRRLRERTGKRHVTTVELRTGIGKWRAVREGARALNEDGTWVAVLDADGAFTGKDLGAVVAPVVAREIQH